MKKFLSNSLSGVGAGVTLAAAAGEAIAVVVAGDVRATGDVPATGETPAAGLAAAGAAGDAPGGGGGGWPNEVNARVTEQRLAISSVFIGLIVEFFPRLEFGSGFPLRLSSIRQA